MTCLLVSVKKNLSALWFHFRSPPTNNFSKIVIFFTHVPKSGKEDFCLRALRNYNLPY